MNRNINTAALVIIVLCNTLVARCPMQLIIWSGRLGVFVAGTLTMCLAWRCLPGVHIVTAEWFWWYLTYLSGQLKLILKLKM